MLSVAKDDGEKNGEAKLRMTPQILLHILQVTLVGFAAVCFAPLSMTGLRMVPQILFNILQMFLIRLTAMDLPIVIVQVIETLCFFGMQNGIDGIEAGIADGRRR